MASAQKNFINLFIKFAAKEIGLSTLPKIHLVGKEENKYNAFGHSKGREIFVRIADRHPGDIMRTIAHELIHFKQNIMRKRGEQFKEDEANALAGRIMRKFNNTYPSVFKLQSIRENEAPVNAVGVGMGSGVTGGIQGYDPLLNAGKMMRRHPKKLKDIINKELKKDKQLGF